MQLSMDVLGTFMTPVCFSAMSELSLLWLGLGAKNDLPSWESEQPQTPLDSI